MSRSRWIALGALMAVIALPAGAHAADTALSFDDISSGTLNDQYASRGVVFHDFTCLGGDTTPNTVVESNPAARSLPQLVHAGNCLAEGFGAFEGFYAEFSAPQSHVALFVRDLANPAAPDPATLDAYDKDGNALGHAQVTATNAGWTSLSVAQGSGQAPAIAAVFINRAGTSESLAADDFSFGVDSSGGGGDGGGGGAGGSQPPPPGPPVASFISGKSPTVKGALWLSGKDSKADAGGVISRYQWDFNGDGTYDADCPGNAPAVSHPFSRAGTYTVGLRVTDSLGAASVTSQVVQVTKANVNKASRAASIFLCENPLGANQADRPGCVKTFAFGIVEVNGRGDENQCFHVVTRSLLSSQVAHVGIARTIARPLSDYFVYHATINGPIALNGLPIPVPTSVKTEYDSWEATVSIGTFPITLGFPGIVVKTFAIPLQLKVIPTKGRYQLPPMKTGKLKLFGLKMGGGVDIALLNGRKSEIKISLILPAVFSNGLNKEAEGRVTVQASNQGGLEFEGARIAHIPHLFFGPVLVNDLFFDYTRTGNIWRGGANFQLLPVSPVEIKAAPPPPDYGFGLRDGSFWYGGGGVAFPVGAQPVLFPGINLAEIGGAFGVKPIRFTGRIGINVGGVIGIDGSAFVAFATQDTPYDFPEEYAPPGLEFLSGRTLDTLSIAIGGQLKLVVPVIKEVPLYNAYVFYAYPDYVEFGGGFRYSVADRFSVDGGVGGFVAIGQRKFNIEGHVTGCADLEITKFCLGVSAVVSSQGIAFCTIVPVPVPFDGTIPVPAGIGYHWGGGVDIMVFSCDTGPYKEARPNARAAATGSSFTLRAGLPSAMIKVVGSDAPPKVELTGPDGRHILAPQDDPALVRKDVVVIPQTPEHTTLIAIKQPPGGRWTLTPRAGSSAITSVATADGLAEPRVKARVTGRGAHRVLRYTVRPEPGQRVTFLEHGDRTYRQLGLARAPQGSIRFTSAAGRAGRRAIVAQIERRGMVVANRVVAHYDAAAPARPGRPRGLRVRRTKQGIVVRWGPARGAFRYAVSATQSNGTRYTAVTRKRRVLFRDFNRLAGGTVLVRALRRDSVGGRSARATLPRLRTGRSRRP